MYFLVNSLSLVFLPHGGFKRLKWDISRITIAFWKICIIWTYSFESSISYHDKMILFTGQAFQMPTIKDLKVHKKILNQQVFLKFDLFSCRCDIDLCVSIFSFFCFWQWGEWVEETVDGESNVLKFTLLDRIIWSFSQPNYFLSQIIRWPSFFASCC